MSDPDLYGFSGTAPGTPPPAGGKDNDASPESRIAELEKGLAEVALEAEKAREEADKAAEFAESSPVTGRRFQRA